MLHLARQSVLLRASFHFRFLHVDTGWKFKDMIAFRDQHGKRPMVLN